MRIAGLVAVLLAAWACWAGARRSLHQGQGLQRAVWAVAGFGLALAAVTMAIDGGRALLDAIAALL